MIAFIKRILTHFDPSENIPLNCDTTGKKNLKIILGLIQLPPARFRRVALMADAVVLQCINHSGSLTRSFHFV